MYPYVYIYCHSKDCITQKKKKMATPHQLHIKHGNFVTHLAVSECRRRVGEVGGGGADQQLLRFHLDEG